MTRTRLVVVEVVRIGQSAYADTTLPCSCLSASGREGTEISAEGGLLGRQHLIPQGYPGASLPSLSGGLVQPSGFSNILF